MVIFPIEINAVENDAEIRLINWYKKHGANLVNATIGGEGCSGFKLSEEAKNKLRIANLGKKQSLETIEKRASKHRGRKNSEETIRKMSEVKLGKQCPWVSQRNSDPIFIEKSRIARIKKWAITPKKGEPLETRIKRSERMKGVKKSAETIRRMCIAQSERRRKNRENGLVG